MTAIRVIDVHSELDGLTTGDDHTQYLLLAGRAGGQIAYGGTGSTDELQLGGSSHAQLSYIQMLSPVKFNSYTANPTAQYGFDYPVTVTENITVAFIGGGLNFSGTINFSNSTFIYESFRGSPVITTGTTLGFAAYTVLQALPTLKGGSASNRPPLSPLVLNCGAVCENPTAGTTMTTGSMAIINGANQVRASAVLANMNITAFRGLTMAPTYSTVSGSSVNFGTITALYCQVPTVALFQPSAGSETMTAYYGIYYNNMAAFGGNVPKVAVYSAQTAASNAYFLQNAGGAQSDFGLGQLTNVGGISIPLDAWGISFGLSTDVNIGWGAAGFYFMQFNASTDQLQWSNPSSERYLWNTKTGTSEYNFNCAKFSLGAQTGAVGNQVGVFVAPTRTTSAAGGWSDFLLTQAGNITVNHAMSQLAGWTINAPSITLGTGTVTDAMALLIGGNVNQGTNRYGLLVLSSPSGGTLNYCARFQGAAGVRVDGSLFMLGGSGTFFQSPVMTTTQRNTMTTAWGAAEQGREWFNSTTGQGEAWNGAAIVVRY